MTQDTKLEHIHYGVRLERSRVVAWLKSLPECLRADGLASSEVEDAVLALSDELAAHDGVVPSNPRESLNEQVRKLVTLVCETTGEKPADHVAVFDIDDFGNVGQTVRVVHLSDLAPRKTTPV